jgi:acyl dehydratase
MSGEIPDIPASVTALVGKKQYEENTTFDIEMGYVYNTCAAVHNGNPLFWDAQVAESITSGPIAPPTMMSVWFRPHYWAPGAEGEQKPLMTHFDLKELLQLPEAIIAGNEMTFGEPVRPGDTLRTYQVVRSISEVKKTKVGFGRFWVIDVEVVNQRGDFVGKDTYTCLGYRRSAA